MPIRNTLGLSQGKFRSKIFTALHVCLNPPLKVKLNVITLCLLRSSVTDTDILCCLRISCASAVDISFGLSHLLRSEETSSDEKNTNGCTDFQRVSRQATKDYDDLSSVNELYLVAFLTVPSFTIAPAASEYFLIDLALGTGTFASGLELC